MTRAAIYIRSGHDAKNQEHRLIAAAEKRDWQVVAVFDELDDQRYKRPKLSAVLDAAQRRDFDVLMVWGVEQIAESVIDLATLTQELVTLGVDLFLEQQALDTTTTSGRGFAQALATMMEYERLFDEDKRLRQRCNGPIPKIEPWVVRRVERELAAGASVFSVARKHRLQTNTVTSIRDGQNYWQIRDRTVGDVDFKI